MPRRIRRRFSRNAPKEAGQPPVDVKDEGDEYVVHADLPGANREDIDVTARRHRVEITAEPAVKEGELPEGGISHIRERPRGPTRRTITLPEAVEEGEVSATYGNGVLTLHLPKREERKARQIPVETA